MPVVDYKKMYEESKDGVFPAYKAGLYVCEICDFISRPDNVYNGVASPQILFLLKPVKMATSNAPLTGTDGKERPNHYKDPDGNERSRYFFYGVGVNNDGCPLSVHEKSNFGKLLNALFGETLPPKKFENFPDAFLGQKLIAQISVQKKETGSSANKIEALSNWEENVVVPDAPAPIKEKEPTKLEKATKEAEEALAMFHDNREF
jgi:hypothetical protein